MELTTSRRTTLLSVTTFFSPAADARSRSWQLILFSLGLRDVSTRLHHPLHRDGRSGFTLLEVLVVAHDPADCRSAGLARALSASVARGRSSDSASIGPTRGGAVHS